MNEQEQSSQLSALYDGELPPEQADMVIRRALRDPSLRASWGRYALIGACLRGDSIAGALQQTDIAARVRTRLTNEKEHGTARSVAEHDARLGARRLSVFGRGALGGAIAAGVAAVSLVIVRALSPAELPAVPAQLAQQGAAIVDDTGLPEGMQSGATVAQVAHDSTPPSYVTPPVDDSPAGRLNAPLFNYVVAHGAGVPSAALVSVMNDSYDPTQGTVEVSDADVGANR